VELIIVMSLMVIAISIAAPSLKFFLKGRSHEDEARRFLEFFAEGKRSFARARRAAAEESDAG